MQKSKQSRGINADIMITAFITNILCNLLSQLQGTMKCRISVVILIDDVVDNSQMMGFVAINDSSGEYKFFRHSLSNKAR